MVVVLLGFVGAGAVPGELGGRLRYGRDDEEDDERDGGRELISGHIAERNKMRMRWNVASHST